MDDLLIIVLTLVFTVLALINQNKKKKQAAKDQIPDIWKTIFPDGEPEFETFSAEQATETPVRPYVKKTGPVKRKEPFTRPAGEGIRNENVIRFGETKPPAKETAEETETDLDCFSLRKAVIYSEILNPKYL